MKAYEIFERDLKKTKFGGRFYLSNKQVEGKHIFVPDDELKEELEALGLHDPEIWIELEFPGIMIMVGSDRVDDYMIVDCDSVFDVLNAYSVSELNFMIYNLGITETKFVEMMESHKCHCHDHEYEDEEPIPSPKKSSKKAPKVS